MKKIFAISILTFCLASFITAFAEFRNSPLKDGAGFLTGEELGKLTETINDIRESYDIDVAIVTESEMSGADAESTADDIFDYGGYGAGEGADGIMLYVSEEPRNYHMTTHGSAINYFTDGKLIYIEEAFLPYLRNNDYYSAFESFALKCDEILYKAYNHESGGDEAAGYPYSISEDGEYDDYSESDIRDYIAGFILILPILIALIATKSKLSKMNTAVGQKYAANYVKPNSMKLTDSKDLFLYSSVTKSARLMSEDSDTSTTHESSSGETHGGRGGSY